MYDTRYSRDDLIPSLRDAGIAADVREWITANASQEFLTELIQIKHGIILLTAQLRQLISDLQSVGDLEGANVESLPVPIVRPAAPGGIGIGNGNVWANPPSESYQFRFYVNGEHKLTLTDYYITDLASIGAVSGDVVQIAVVSDDGVVGWWARKAVP